MRALRGGGDRDDLPGADDEPQPRVHDRQPDRGGGAHAPARCAAQGAWARAVEMLDRVGIPDPQRRVKDYPHAFSGGMRQRAMIAMALVVRSEAAHRRRADDRARRHDPGADPRAAEDAAARHRDGDPVRHPRPRRRRRHLRPRRGHVRRARSSSRRRSTTCSTRPRHPYADGLLASMPQVDAARRAAHGDPRPGAAARTSCRSGAGSRARCDYARGRVHVAPRAVAGPTDGARRVRCVRVPPSSTLARLRAHARVETGDERDADPDGRAAAPGPRARKEFPVQQRLLRREIGRGARGRRRRLRRSRRRDARSRGRERLGQVDRRRDSCCGSSSRPRARSSLDGDGRSRSSRSGESSARARRDMQMVFQDPYSSLDPRRPSPRRSASRSRCTSVCAAASATSGCAELLEQVGMGRDHAAPVPVRVLGRPAPAHRDRPRARARPEADRARRAGERRSTCRRSRR